MTIEAPRLLRAACYFPVHDVALAVEYYERVFGFRIEYAALPHFAIIARDGHALMLREVARNSRIVPNEKQGGTWDAFFWVNDAAALHEELVAKGATIVYGPIVQDLDRMNEFAARDRSGYVLGFGQALT